MRVLSKKSLCTAIFFSLLCFIILYPHEYVHAERNEYKTIEDIMNAINFDGICDEYTKQGNAKIDELNDIVQHRLWEAGIWQVKIKWDHMGLTCAITDAPVDMTLHKEKAQANGSSHFEGSCPCPGGLEVTVDGCHLNFQCKTADDNDTIVSVTSPCPVIRGTNPKYPLVKMLSGTLIEWEDGGNLDSWIDVSYGAPEGLGDAAQYYGAKYYSGVHYKMVLSSIDIGSGVKFDIDIANTKKNAKDLLDRKNIEYFLVGENPYVEVLSQKDIYEAYQNRSKYVQSFLFAGNKDYGQRPWRTYDQFIEAMCDMSANYKRCIKELSYVGHKDTEMLGSLYLGSGNTSIIGLYSEVSSHNCHGAVWNGEDWEFAINVESEWCLYISAEWGAMNIWELDRNEYVGTCCAKSGYRDVDCGTVCDKRQNMKTGEYEDVNCHTECVHEWYCDLWQDKYLEVGSWHNYGGGTSSGDCGICKTVTGYINPYGQMTTEPFGISFYQSQPLLVKPGE